MPTFSDIPEDHPYYDAIEWMAELGISIGYPDGTYRSDEPLSRGEMAVFLQRYDGSAPPDPEPTGLVVWQNDFENGSLIGASETPGTGSRLLRFSSGSGTLHDIVIDPTGRSDKVLKMTGDTTDGNQSGNRARLNSWLNSDSDPWNLPEDGTYETWFYLEHDQTSNNLFQWKQAWSNDLTDPLNRTKWQTRHPLHWFRINHAGGGVHNLYLRASHSEDGRIDPNAPNRTVAQLDGAVRTGQWHYLKARHKYSETDGIVEAWLDGTKFADLHGVRTHCRTVQDAAFGDPLPGQPTFIEQFCQWTVNNYMISGSGVWSPAKTTIYFDELKITRGFS